MEWLYKYWWIIRYNLFSIIIGMLTLLLFCIIVEIIANLSPYWRHRIYIFTYCFNTENAFCLWQSAFYDKLNVMNINTILRRIIIGSIFLVPFIPLIVAPSMFFPFITGKNFAFRILVEIMFAFWLISSL